MVTFKHTHRSTKIVVTTGDITGQKVDAIVNPANSRMLMGGGVAGAIKRIGGKEIEEEAVKKGSCSSWKSRSDRSGGRWSAPSNWESRA